MAGIDCSLENGAFSLAVEIPPNSSAAVRLPRANLADVSESGKPLALARGVLTSEQEDRSVVVEIGSGRYQFSYPMLP